MDDSSRSRIAHLEHAIRTFLVRPGCNPTQRRAAFRRLAWALNPGDMAEVGDAASASASASSASREPTTTCFYCGRKQP